MSYRKWLVRNDDLKKINAFQTCKEDNDVYGHNHSTLLKYRLLIIYNFAHLKLRNIQGYIVLSFTNCIHGLCPFHFVTYLSCLKSTTSCVCILHLASSTYLQSYKYVHIKFLYNMLESYIYGWKYLLIWSG